MRAQKMIHPHTFVPVINKKHYLATNLQECDRECLEFLTFALMKAKSGLFHQGQSSIFFLHYFTFALQDVETPRKPDHQNTSYLEVVSRNST